MPDLIIDHSTSNDILFPAGLGRGYEERDFSIHPAEMFAAPAEIDLVNPNDYDGLLEELEANQSTLEHIRMKGNYGSPIMSLDQNGDPLCWGHSTTHAAMLKRAQQNQPYRPLSAYGLAMLATGGKNKGGWCGLSAKVGRELGIPLQEDWKQGDLRMGNDTSAMRARAANYKITEDWVDLAKPVYSQNLTQAQVFSCLLRAEPCALDFNWWEHSVCGIRMVKIEAGSYGIKIWNSWYVSRGVEWGTKGMAVLRGERAFPNGALAIRAITPAMAA